MLKQISPLRYEMTNINRFELGKSTMHIIVWQFEVTRENIEEFKTIYGAEGEWAKLFSLGSGYLGTELLQSLDSNSRFITLDRWQSRDSFDGFKQQYAAAYAQLDARCDGLTLHEEKIGEYLRPDSLGSTHL